MHNILVFYRGAPIGHTFAISREKPVTLYTLGKDHNITLSEVPLGQSMEITRPFIDIETIEDVACLSNFFPTVEYRPPSMMVENALWHVKETACGRKTILSGSEYWIYTPKTGEEAKRMHVRGSSEWHILFKGKEKEPDKEVLRNATFWSLFDAKKEAQQRSITLHVNAPYPHQTEEIGEIYISDGGAQFIFTRFLQQGIDAFWGWNTAQEVISRYYWEYEQKIST